MPVREEGDCTFLPLVCNALLVVGKGIVGILANSNALVSDAIHSMTDVSGFYMNYCACRDCRMYERIDRNKTSNRISEKAAQAQVQATYHTGIVLFTVGLAICFHNAMILLLDRVEQPDPISAVVAFVVVVVYAAVFIYSERSGRRGA